MGLPATYLQPNTSAFFRLTAGLVHVLCGSLNEYSAFAADPSDQDSMIQPTHDQEHTSHDVNRHGTTQE